MMSKLPGGALLLLAGCAELPPVTSAPSPAVQVQADAAPATLVSTGATIEPSGFATVLTAPVPDYSQVVERTPPPPPSPAHWYAEETGISVEEARRRTAEQQAILPELERLQERLQRDEADNFIGVEMVHRPDWSYRFYFKRDPRATLARYTANPRFVAAQGGRHTSEELRRLAGLWLRPLTEAGITSMIAVDPIENRVTVPLTITREAYQALAERQGWGEPPPEIVLEFAGDLNVPSVDPRAAPLLRAFGSDTQPTIIQLEAGSSARIVLVDGCLRLGTGDGSLGPLVYFHRETGIGFDEEGYIGLVDRRTGAFKGRIGEDFVWAGPNRFRDVMPGLDELKRRCGDEGVEHVGNPESKARFEARHGPY